MNPKRLTNSALNYENLPPLVPVRGASLFIERLSNTKKEILTKNMDRRINSLKEQGKYLWAQNDGEKLLHVYQAIESIRLLKRSL